MGQADFQSCESLLSAQCDVTTKQDGKHPWKRYADPSRADKAGMQNMQNERFGRVNDQ